MKARMVSHASKAVGLAIIFAVLVFIGAGCSNDGDGEGFAGVSDSGVLVLGVTPPAPVVGTLAFVTLNFSAVDFDDFDEHGLIVKFILSDALQYIPSSAVLVTANQAQSIAPVFTGAVPDDASGNLADELDESGMNFVVFTLFADDLGGAKSGHLQFDVRAAEVSSSARVLADVDRGAVTEFDPQNPSFDIEVEANVVVGEVEEEEE